MLTGRSEAMGCRFSAHSVRSTVDLFEKLLWFLLLIENICFLALSSYGWGIYVMIAVALLFAIVAIAQSRMRIGLSVGVFHKLLFAFCAFGLLSAGWAIDSSRAISRSVTLFELLILVSIFYAHYAVRPVRESLDGLVKALMWSGYILSLYTIYTVGPADMLEGLTGGGRLDTDYANINSIGMNCALSVVIASFYAFYRKPQISLLLVMPCLLVVAATASRKALLLVILGVALIALSAMSGKSFTRKILFVTVMAAVVIAAVRALSELGIFSTVFDRFDGFVALFSGQGEVDASSAERAEMIEIGLAQFFKTPILGIGLDNSYYLVGTYLHNNYVELLADLGIVGFSIYYALYAYIIYSLWKNRHTKDPYGLLIAVFVAILLVMDFASVSYFSKSTFMYLMIMYLYVGLSDDAKDVAPNFKVQKKF